MDPFQSALELAASIRAKKISPVEAVDFYLGRIDAINPVINAVTWRRDEAVRAEAAAAERALMRGDAHGPFFGVPLAIKDLTFVEGWPMTFGSRATADFVAPFTATVMQGFRDAGFLFFARTNTPELGILCVTENDLWGATRNPWDTERTPGGSSGGAAAAVAATMAPIAHASDGGGSIRIPAACCGLVGLKCSRGRISMGPMVSDVMHGGVTEGCVSRTVADTAALYDTICQPDPGAWYNAPPLARPLLEEVGAPVGRLRVGFSTRAPTGASVDQSSLDAVHHTARLLADLGHEVFESTPDWPAPEETVAQFLTVWNTGTALWPIEDWSKVEPLTAAMREQAARVNSLDYVRALASLQIYTRQIVAAWGRDFDVLVTPTLAVPPPPIGALFEGADEDPMMPLMKAASMAAFTPLINTTGQPAISLPLHWTDSGLPIGVQIIGKPWGEAELIRLAAQLESASDWSSRRPPAAVCPSV